MIFEKQNIPIENGTCKKKRTLNSLPNPAIYSIWSFIVPLLVFGCGNQQSANKTHTVSIKPPATSIEVEKFAPAIRLAETYHSSAFLLLHNGKIVVEHYWTVDPSTLKQRNRFTYQRLYFQQTSDQKPIEDVASVQKSIVALLMAIAVEKSLLSYNDSVQQYLEAGWSKVPEKKEAAITLHHLLSMTSGLNNRLEFIAPPGNVWSYNTKAYQLLHQVLERATGKSSNELLQLWLANPLGLTNSTFIPRTFGLQKNQLGLTTTARDLARIGELILNDGSHQGHQILSRDSLRRLLSPSQEQNPSYGYLWWLNGQSKTIMPSGKEISSSLFPSAPKDLVMALGALDRHLAISKKHNLVMVRLGASATGPTINRQLFNELWQKILLAIES